MKASLILMAVLFAAALVFAEGQLQTTCPVMKGNPVTSESPYVDVEGVRIFVCCGGCIGAVKADPAEYIKHMKAEGVEPATIPESSAVE